MAEKMEDLFDEGISPVLFVNYTETVEAVVKRLTNTKKMKDQVCLLVGGQSEKVRHAELDAFQNNTKRIMVANLAAGNAGVDMHDLDGRFPRYSIVSPSFSAINLIQALGRIHRAEGKSPCEQTVFFAADTIEEHACRRVQAKINNIDSLNDGDLTSGINLV
jgi:superfamily II DNA or RNA helicase